MRKLLTSITLSITSVVLAALLAEGILRVMGHQSSPSTTAQTNERPATYFLPSPGRQAQDFAVPVEKSSNIFRIAVIGDSFSFAPKMQFDDTFSKRLERFLNLNQQSDSIPQRSELPLRAEVLNFGTPGFGLSQEAHLLPEALRYRPDIVLFQITLNDAQLRPLNMEPAEIQRKYGRLPLDMQGSWWLRNSLLIRFIMQRLHNQRTVQNYIQYHYELFREERSRRAYEKALDSITTTLGKEAPQTKVVAVLFPLFDFPLEASGSSPYPFIDLHREIRALWESRGIEVLDLFRSFRGLDRERLQLIPGSDSHPNEIAHRIAAEQILKGLVRRRMIPTSLIPQRVAAQRDNVNERTSAWRVPRSRTTTEHGLKR